MATSEQNHDAIHWRGPAEDVATDLMRLVQDALEVEGVTVWVRRSGVARFLLRFGTGRRYEVTVVKKRGG